MSRASISQFHIRLGWDEHRKVWHTICDTGICSSIFMKQHSRYWGANVAVTNLMSHFSMFFPINATVKLANGSTGHAQVIAIILCRFPNCSIIYPVGPVYYYPGHPSNTISLDYLNFLLVFKTLHLNLLKIVTLLALRVVLQDYHTRLTKILTIFNSKFSRSTLTETRIFLSQLSVGFQNKLSLKLFISILVMSLSPE